MVPKSASVRKSGSTRLKLPAGVKPATSKMSSELLADVVSDRGIASGGRHTVRMATKG
jgi:hypothetical protein